MKKREMREHDVFYCDICHEECGLPYYGLDAIGYGSCCAPLMRKLAEAEVIDELRAKIPFFEDFFDTRERHVSKSTAEQVMSGESDEL